jgi:UDP-2,3-diacylglucosamine hydrolase
MQLPDLRELPAGKKVYFASDFHLGVPSREQSLVRERKLIRWLEMAEQDAAAIFLMGDTFDFWFEYRHVIPKGFARLQGKLAALTDAGIPVVFFVGNHDMWMFDYFPTEFGIPVFYEPVTLEINGKRLLIGHGDGLGPGDYSYKFLKKIFRSRLCQWLFARLHPNLGMGIANFWSRRSRLGNAGTEEQFMGDKEYLWAYCKERHANDPHHYYVFGHRHLPLNLEVGDTGRYINLGEWVHHFTYAVWEGQECRLEVFEG